MSSLHPIRKRTALLPTRKQHILPQLRLLAPKPKTLPVQHKLELDNNNNRERQDTDREATTANVKVQHLTLQSSAPGPSVSPSYDTTPSQLLSPDSTVSCLEEKQYAVVVSSTDIYSNRVPLISVDDCFPEFTLGNKLSGVVTHGVSTHNLPYSNLQLQETIQNQYCIPIPDTAEVWTSMAQPTIDVYQGQCSINSIWLCTRRNEHILISIWLHRSVVPIHYRSTPPHIHSTTTGCSTCVLYTTATSFAERVLYPLPLDLVFPPWKHHV